MLTLLPRRRIASRVPSTNSLRRSTLCWCQRLLRPSLLTVTDEVCCATIAVIHSLVLLDSTGGSGIKRCWLGPALRVVADDVGVAHRPDIGTHARTEPPPRSFAESLAGADSAADAERRRGLRRMKLVALSFLLGATVIFLLCTWAQSNGAPGWVGYVRAAAEAGMIGALADWFAVTALFKHPMGIPIPHTAIIKRKKDQLGEGLGTFVRENFMSAEVVETKLRDAEVAGRLGKWLSDSSHAERVAAETSTVLRVVVEMLRDEDVQHVLDRMIVKRIAEPKWGPPIGRVLASLLAEGRQEALIQLLADRAFQWSLNAGDTIERVIERDSPTWSPRWVDHLVGDRIHRELMDFTDKVRRNPEHELRRSATRFLFEFADDLQNDDATIERAENVT